jgi:hypothetical protein
VTPEILDQCLDWVLERLYEIGFQDIQRDWVRFEIVESFDSNENTLGLHFDNGSVVSNRGRYGFDQTIQVVHYLNQIELCQVLAHELLHAWQIQNNLVEYCDYHEDIISQKVCEGFAQMGSYHIYDYIKRHAQNKNKRLANYANHNINNMLVSPDPIYGIPFQIIYEHFQKLREPKWYSLIKEARTSKLKELFDEQK